MTYQKKIGDRGEAIAAVYLQDKGYLVLEENYHSMYGELDLIALDRQDLVFVEVKTRTSTRFGFPEMSVTPDKLEKIQKTGLMWLQEHPEAPDDWRIEVLGILLDKNQNLIEIKHYETID
jgi:putative endonuclease